jgi:UDP-N-acetylmuramate dehydrogenase
MTVEWHADADLSARNTLRLPSRADRLALVDDATDVRAVLARARDAGWPVHVLGGGSNVVLPRRVRGLVLMLRDGRVDRAADGDAVRLRVGGGLLWDDLVRRTAGAGLWGLENLALIPGRVGAAPVQNIGAYGAELSETCRGLEIVDLHDGRIASWGARDCAFGYRDSRLRREPGRWLVTTVEFRLPVSGEARLDYPGVAEALGSGDASDPAAVAAAVRALRRRRLPDPATEPNAGSFFKNPVLTPSAWDALRAAHPEAPGRTVDEGRGVKVPAAWLIERCGWRGRREGGVGVSATHALVLVHHGGADGAALLAFADAIRRSVADRFGIELEPEPVRLGWSEADGHP